MYGINLGIPWLVGDNHWILQFALHFILLCIEQFLALDGNSAHFILEFYDLYIRNWQFQKFIKNNSYRYWHLQSIAL